MTNKVWKVVAALPSGKIYRNAAFDLLYSFPTKEEAEESATLSVMNVVLVEIEKAPAK